jgi:hypothetical protein
MHGTDSGPLKKIFRFGFYFVLGKRRQLTPSRRMQEGAF